MAGKTKPQAKLHKTKTGPTKKGQDALAQLVASCNEQVNTIECILKIWMTLRSDYGVLEDYFLSFLYFSISREPAFSKLKTSFPQ
jgi:hypothetical protein